MKTDSVAEMQDASKLITGFIANIPLFDELDMSELALVAERMNLIELNPEEILFEEWDKGDYICFIESGTFELLKKSAANAYVAMATLGRGKSIGEMSIIEHFPRSATLKALSPARVLTFSRKEFESVLAFRPDIGIKLLKGLARLLGHNLRKASSRLSDYMMPMG